MCIRDRPQALDRLEGFAEFGGRAADAHADAATAGSAFQHHRVADLLAGYQRSVEVFQKLGAFEHGYAMLFGQGAGGVLCLLYTSFG